MKKIIPLELVFFAIKIKRNIQSMYQNNAVKKNMLTYYCRKKGGGKQYLLIKDFNTFMFDYSLHGGRKHFCCYSLNSFVTEEILKHNIKD